jgi:plastocyanin
MLAKRPEDRAMFRWALIILVHLHAVGQAAEIPGQIAGTVRYTGVVPPPTRITTTDGGVIMHRDLIVDPRTQGLHHVVATLENAPAQPKNHGAKPVLIDQRDMLFLPRVIGIRHGTPVVFENNDICNHNVMAVSTVPANQINVFVTQGKPFEHVFEAHKHPISIGCSLHPWMRAWVFVVPHPWIAVTNERGEFRLSDVPPGKYNLLLRHPDAGHLERHPVEVEAGKRIDLKIEWKKIGDKESRLACLIVEGRQRTIAMR